MKLIITILISLNVLFANGQRFVTPTMDKGLRMLFNTSKVKSNYTQVFQDDWNSILIVVKITRYQKEMVRYFKYDKIANTLKEIKIKDDAQALGYRRDTLYSLDMVRKRITPGEKRWNIDLGNRLVNVLSKLINKNVDLVIQDNSFILLQKNNKKWKILASIGDGLNSNEYVFEDSTMSVSGRVFLLEKDKFLTISYHPKPEVGEPIADIYWWNCLSNGRKKQLNSNMVISDIFDVKRIDDKLFVLGHEFGVGYFIANIIFNGSDLKLQNIKRSHIQDSYSELKLLNSSSFAGLELGPFINGDILKIHKID